MARSGPTPRGATGAAGVPPPTRGTVREAVPTGDLPPSGHHLRPGTGRGRAAHREGDEPMFEMLSIACTAAMLGGGSCAPHGAAASAPPAPDSYEMRVGPGMYQLSYAARGDRFDSAALTEHWRRRASQLCAGDYVGQPLQQTTHPDPGYDAMVSLMFITASRTWNTEVYGVAHCDDPRR